MSSKASAALFPATARHANVALIEYANLERYGSYTRLHSEGRSFTNVDELHRASHLARCLADAGVRPGDRVLTVMPNCADLTACFQAIWNVGAVVVPGSPLWTTAELAYALDCTEATTVLTVATSAPRVREACTQAHRLPRLLCFGESGMAEFENIASVCAEAGDALYSPVERTAQEPAMLLFTSGTLARPKAVIVTHGAIPAAMESVHRVNPALPRRAILHVLPLHHVFGILMLQLANYWGFSSVLMSQFDPPTIFRAIPQYQVGYMLMVPTMLLYLLHHPERPAHDYSSLYRIITGGAALPEPLRLAFQQAFRCRVDQGYGMSEAGFISCYGDHEGYRAGSSGWPCPGFEMRVVDDEDRPLPALSHGEICIRGASVTPGYWHDPEATQAAVREGWFHTGDVGYVDADGYLYITDRKKDLIIKGGENISPREIEEAMYLHPAVAEVAVVGVPDAQFGEQICAVVRLREGSSATAEELRTHMTRYVSHFKVPSTILFHSALPRTAMGKVHKQRLREELAVSMEATA